MSARAPLGMGLLLLALVGAGAVPRSGGAHNTRHAHAHHHHHHHDRPEHSSVEQALRIFDKLGHQRPMDAAVQFPISSVKLAPGSLFGVAQQRNLEFQLSLNDTQWLWCVPSMNTSPGYDRRWLRPEQPACPGRRATA